MKLADRKTYLKEKEIAKLGPEPADVKDVKALYNKWKDKKVAIKTLLLSQEVVAGLGNIYVDEALFASQIHPHTPANFTVDVFIKMNRHVNYPLLVGKVRTGSSPTWSLSLSGADDLVRCRFDTYPVDWNLGEHTYAENSQNGFNQCFSTGVPGNDGKWHHAAFSYETATKNVKIYVDYVLKANGTTINPIVYTDGDILIGMGAGERAFDGWIDEVRITPRLLTPDEFLYTQPRLGTLITLD